MVSERHTIPVDPEKKKNLNEEDLKSHYGTNLFVELAEGDLHETFHLERLLLGDLNSESSWEFFRSVQATSFP